MDKLNIKRTLIPAKPTPDKTDDKPASIFAVKGSGQSALILGATQPAKNNEITTEVAGGQKHAYTTGATGDGSPQRKKLRLKRPGTTTEVPAPKPDASNSAPKSPAPAPKPEASASAPKLPTPTDAIPTSIDAKLAAAAPAPKTPAAQTDKQPVKPNETAAKKGVFSAFSALF